MNKTTRMAIIMGGLLSVSSCAIHVSAYEAGGGRDLDSVFGGIEIDNNAKVGDLSSVNGGIDLSSGATAKSVETVNGGIEAGDNVTMSSAETVNGGITSGNTLTVKGSLETVNGGIRIDKNSKVAGNVETVNGDIDLTNVIVSKGIRTVNGDITLKEDTVIVGDLTIKKPGSWFSSWSDDRPIITIDSTSAVKGKIHLYRPVELKIEQGASVGEIVNHFKQK